MAEIVKRHKPLSVKPLKSSQPLGASLAFLGINNTIPLLHGSQGCTAFSKIFLIQHFREPIPLQTTAMDQVTTIMGADDNVIEGLKTLADKAQPDLVGVVTTGLSETQGCDIKRVVKAFYAAHPECAAMKVVAVNTPDFNGCLESGFALAATAMINELVPREQVSTQPRQINVLVGSFLTPGDIETLKEVIESFGLRPLVFPDIADALDGHVTERNFTPTSIGGLSVTEIPQLARSVATLVIGASMFTVADTLKDRTGINDYRFETLIGLEVFDQFLLTLQSISGQPVPARFERQRTQLQDAMLDTHFMLGQARFAIAADPDILYALSQFIKSMGGEIVTAVAPIYTELLTQIPINEVKIGDLEDFEQRASAQKAQIVLSNAHAVDSAKRLGIPLLRVGFPQFDWVGGYQRTWIGYRGARQLLFDLANLLLSQHQGIHPYRSQYAQADEPRSPEHLHTSSSSPLTH